MQVHWHEGLFLLPHHLQRIQRSILETSSFERRLKWAYPYGLIDARLSNDDLENMRLRFDRLHAIMPSGQEILFPQEAELPAMDIKQAFESRGRFVVYLGLPLWFDARANCVSPGQTVARGQLIAAIGLTGVTTGPHVHWELKVNGVAQDPLAY